MLESLKESIAEDEEGNINSAVGKEQTSNMKNKGGNILERRV